MSVFNQETGLVTYSSKTDPAAVHLGFKAHKAKVGWVSIMPTSDTALIRRFARELVVAADKADAENLP